MAPPRSNTTVILAKAGIQTWARLAYRPGPDYF